MKRIVMAALLLLPLWSSAQPTPTAPSTNDATQFGIRRSMPAPIAPATLLLLGLGGVVTGTMVYRNTKKGGEE